MKIVFPDSNQWPQVHYREEALYTKTGDKETMNLLYIWNADYYSDAEEKGYLLSIVYLPGEIRNS